jgi:PAS domain S-box-containing protein
MTLHGNFLLTARTVAASHGASILAITPLVLVGGIPRASWPRREALIQWVVLAAAIAYVFAPSQTLALSFLPMPVLAWAAVRASLRVVSLQLLLVSVMTTLMSIQGWGPFAVLSGGHLRSTGTTGALVQAFLIACALIALPLAVAVEQRRGALSRVTQSEELFRKSFTDSMVGMVLLRHTAEGTLRIVEVNETAGEILGGTDDGDLEGRDWGALLSSPTPLDTIVQELLTGVRGGWRDEVLLADDSSRRVAVSLSPLSGHDGEAMFTAQMIDITAAHDASHRLRTEKDFTAAILNTTGCLIIVVDIGSGCLVGMNPAAQEVTGYDEHEVMDRPFWEMLIPAEDRVAVEAAYSSPSGAAVPLTQESDLCTKLGARRRVMWSSAFLSDGTGLRTHVVMTGIDVTNERTTAGLVGHLMRAASTTAFIGTALDGRVTVFNSGAERMVGYPAREMIGRYLPVDLFDPLELAARAADLGVPADLRLLTKELEKTGLPQTSDWTCVRKDGSRFTASVTISPVTDAFGQHIGYLGVGNDVTEQRRGQELLIATLQKEREAVDRLRQLDQAKSDFVSTVSHELRTPITSISGYTEMLQDGVAGDLTPGQNRLVDAVRRNGDRLIALADDLLTLSSFESGTFTLDATIVDVRDVVHRAQETLSPLTVDRKLDISFEMPHQPVSVTGDPSHLERVVFNLVSNAVKFTEDGGTIRCRLYASAQEAVLEVSDTGIGIPQAEQAGLFTRFFRSSTAQERAIQGTGLGLSIVSSIVQSHGGEITVESAHMEGTTFTVRLPLVEKAAYVGSHAAR